MAHQAQTPSCDSQSGFTLIEMILTIILLGASAMILLPFFSAISHSPDPVMRLRAVSLGQEMMDEVLAKKWDENTIAGGGPIITTETAAASVRMVAYESTHPGYSPGSASYPVGSDSGEARDTFDDVDDYNGSSESDSNFYDQDGTGFAMIGYQRTVSVCYIPSNSNPITNATSCVGSATDTKLIVVTVTSPTNEVFYFTAVKCNL